MTKSKCEDIVDHYDDEHYGGGTYQETARDEVAVDEVRHKNAHQQQNRDKRRIHQKAFFKITVHHQQQGALSPAKGAVDTEKLFIRARQ